MGLVPPISVRGVEHLLAGLTRSLEWLEGLVLIIFSERGRNIDWLV